MEHKLGKLPARPNAVKFKLSTYATALPVAPAKFSHSDLVTAPWKVLGNDNYGDCVWAGAAHETMLWNKEASKDVVFTDQEVLSDYSAVTGFNSNDPNTDQGTDMQVAASYRRKTGVLGQGTRHQVAAYVSVQLANVSELKQAIYLLSGVGVGFQFPASAMAQFTNGKPWTAVSRSPIEGGHYVPAIGYDSRYVYVVTWGKIQKMSWGFYKKYADEVVAYLSSEFLTGGKSIEGLNLAQLQADIALLP